MRVEPVTKMNPLLRKKHAREIGNKAKMMLALIIAFISIYFFFFKILFF